MPSLPTRAPGVLTAAGHRVHARLMQARSTGLPVPAVRDLLAADDVDGAYAVQRAFVAGELAGGARVSGRKIGLTAPSVQAQLGVDRPDFGVLLDTMARAEHEPIDLSALIAPRIEAEVAFILAADITDPDVDADSVRAAVAYASPALEIVDSRIVGWDITFVDTVADNASAGLYVVGAVQAPLTAFEPRSAVMSMSLDGELVSSGSGADCFGDPLDALAWLARTALAYREPLRAGEVVLSGALGPMITVTPGAHVNASIHGLGEVGTRFVASSTHPGRGVDRDR